MSFLEGVNTGINAFTAIQENRRRDALEQQSAQRENREQQESDSRINLQRIQAMSYQRAMNRDDRKEVAQAELYRLARERAFFDGIDKDLHDDGKIDSQMYLGIWNAQDKDLIDPHNDGRQISRIDQMPDGRWAIGISGPGIDGTQPMTMNRGTAADGDNTVRTFTPDELIHDHLGRSQALSQKYPELGALLNGDPKQLKAYLNAQTTAVKMRMAELGGAASPEDRQTDLEGLRHDNRMSEMKQEHGYKLDEEAAKQKTQGGSSTPREIQIHDDILKNYKENGQPVTDERAWQLTRDQTGRGTTDQQWRYVSGRLAEQSKAGMVEGDDGYKSVDELVDESRNIASSMNRAPDNSPHPGVPAYKTPAEVKAAYKAGTIDRETAKKLIGGMGGVGGG